jgi:hypothetical protein
MWIRNPGSIIAFLKYWFWLDLTGKGELAGIASLIPGFLESAHWILRRVYKIGYNKKIIVF